MGVVVHHGDSRDVLKLIPSNSIDSVVTDPPYALVSIVKRFGADDAAPAQEGASGVYSRASAGFMGQTWDTGETAFAVEFWAEVMRVLKPGGHVVAASGTRTYHRLAVAIEDAGFEIRDMISWLYGSGFPKSHDVSKGIDKARNDKPDVHKVAAFVASGRDAASVTNRQIDDLFGFNGMAGHWTNTKGKQAQVPKWEQWERLKSFLTLGAEMDEEVWRLNGRKGQPGEAWLEREVTGEVEEWADRTNYALTSADGLRRDKPASDDAIAWAGWGTALKPACEPWVLARKPPIGTVAGNVLLHGTGALNIDGCRIGDEGGCQSSQAYIGGKSKHVLGRGLNDQSSPAIEGLGRWPANVLHDGSMEVVEAGLGDAARYFYTAKADAEDRVCECSVCGSLSIGPPHCLCRDPEDATKKAKAGGHPTVKPIDLMQYLCRLVTPKGGTILDPFAGSGTTGTAARREGFNAILIEREDRFAAFIRHRLTCHEEVDMFSL